MEIWDAYLKDGTLASCDLVRGEPIPKGYTTWCVKFWSGTPMVIICL